MDNEVQSFEKFLTDIGFPIDATVSSVAREIHHTNDMIWLANVSNMLTLDEYSVYPFSEKIAIMLDDKLDDLSLADCDIFYQYCD